MTGNTWIIIGLIGGAIGLILSLFCIPYGFHKKSIEHSVKDKKEVDGGFVQIVNFLDAGLPNKRPLVNISGPKKNIFV